jgi:monoterpene epsilon-lactone hydrolase
MPSAEHEQFVAALAALASPLYASDAELANLPTLLIHVGTRESLLDDSRRFVARAKASGVVVDYTEYPGVVHMWVVMAPELPESRQAFDAAAVFLSRLPPGHPG